MSKIEALLVLAMFAVIPGTGNPQMPVLDSFPELKYPPIARAANVQGDVVVSFRQTAQGRTVDVTPISGPTMLQAIAIENVKAWNFKPNTGPGEHVYKVTFNFQLNPPEDGYEENSPGTKVAIDGNGKIQVISIRTTGLNRSECPTGDERVPPAALLKGDFVELERWNEEVTVGADGLIVWKQGGVSKRGQISVARAGSLLDRFRAAYVWRLCGSYSQAGLMDSGSSSLKMRIGGREKTIGEYGDAAPKVFDDVESVIDEAVNTHQWRHGNPETESISEITFEYLPKPGKTRLMDAAHRGDEEAFHAALAAGDKLTDIDASGWTPLMYAASSYGNSPVSEMIKAGADVNARSKKGETALMASAVTGMADEELLNAGAEVNAANDDGMTALMLISQHGDPDEIETLLKAGADAQKKDAKGRTALDYLNAANCGSPIIHEKDPRWMTTGYSRCNALSHDDYEKSERLLSHAGAKQTRIAAPTPLPSRAR